MSTNVLIALSNIILNPITNINYYYKSTNKINAVGDALELYIKDIFCNSLNIDNMMEKEEKFSQNFSYLGNQNNPPDIILKHGDAIEVKKIESANSSIALNSSYPKDKLYCEDTMLTKACKQCEDWEEKDLLYIIGAVKGDILKSLWFIYGDCYAANKETYERIKYKITNGLKELNNIELSETNELGRVNKVDPLGITYLRIRGMWGIENPNKVFKYILSNCDKDFSVNAIMLNKKYNSFPKEDRQNLENINVDNFSINDIKIKCPNNPAILLDAKLISFYK